MSSHPASSTAPSNDPWVVFDYEVEQWRAMCNLLVDGNPVYEALSLQLKNAVTESAVLHTRILADILLCRSKESDDIKVSDLIPGFKSANLGQLTQVYGDRKLPGSPCWTFNKKLAHPTLHRTDSHDYSGPLNAVRPLIETIIAEIQSQRP